MGLTKNMYSQLAPQAVLPCINERHEKGPWSFFRYGSTQGVKMLAIASETQIWASIRSYDGMTGKKEVFLWV
jgi:hypothetical protein